MMIQINILGRDTIKVICRVPIAFRGSRVCHPKIYIFGILVILSRSFLRNKRLKKNL